jgi:wyosine [tRNA(Phe)-imidazoG37] synthetase (radical SAM superfamily)
MVITELHAEHSRSFEANRYVYPVLSRRAGGLSIGVNLNPDKICNFDCVYCQVDRAIPGATKVVDLPRLKAELAAMLESVARGEIWRHAKFRDVPVPLRTVHDIAFSGDGEPTTCRQFEAVVQIAADLKRAAGLELVKLVLITNASRLHRAAVQRGLAIMDRHRGEIWAKLEAGTSSYYQQIDRSRVPFERILANITEAARVRPIVIQALFLRLAGEPPSATELAAFCERLQEIVAAGGRISLVQVYTVARRPAEESVTALSDGEVDAITRLVSERTGLRAESYYGG